LACSIPAAGYVTTILGAGDCDDNNTAINPAATEICGNTIDENRNGQLDEGCALVTMNIKAFIEGYYIGSNSMNATLSNQGLTNPITDCDTIEVNLFAAANIPPAFSYKTILTVTGNAQIMLPASTIGQSYYIAIKHRNSVETWSANPILISSNTSYDFSTSASQAYGANQVAVGNGQYAFYAGDITQDGAIDAFDYIVLDADVVFGNYGYLNTDLTGDGSVDAFDYILLDANLINGISAVTP
jgi:Putative metal-binding motif